MRKASNSDKIVHNAIATVPRGVPTQDEYAVHNRKGIVGYSVGQNVYLVKC